MSGGWEDWRWDESLFAGCAPYYDQGRPPYAPNLASALRDELGLDGTGRLLDVGCGPGSVSLRMASLFEAVVGLDPDPGMLTEAARLAAEQGVTNSTWVRARAEDLPAGLGRFRAVTLAASFHWMDRSRVASTLRGMLVVGGAAVQVDAPGFRSTDRPEGRPGLDAADDAVEELRREWLGPDRRAGQGIRNTSPSGEDQVFQSAGFLPAVELVVPDGRVVERSVDDMVALTLSQSSSAPHLFGERLDDFVVQLREVLSRASTGGTFSVVLADNVLRVWRPRI